MASYTTPLHLGQLAMPLPKQSSAVRIVHGMLRLLANNKQLYGSLYLFLLPPGEPTQTVQGVSPEVPPLIAEGGINAVLDLRGVVNSRTSMKNRGRSDEWV